MIAAFAVLLRVAAGVYFIRARTFFVCLAYAKSILRINLQILLARTRTAKMLKFDLVKFDAKL